LAANIPERKTSRRIRGQARSYKNLSKPRIVGAPLGAAIPEQMVQYGPALDELAVADDDAFANRAQTLGEFFHQIH